MPPESISGRETMGETYAERQSRDDERRTMIFLMEILTLLVLMKIWTLCPSANAGIFLTT